MAILKLEESDFKAGLPLDAGWYRATVKEFKKELNKNRDGINYVPTFTVQDNEGNERQVKTWISDKMRGWALPFGRLISACEGKVHNPKESLSIDDNEIGKFAGTEIWIHTIPTPDNNGKLQDVPDNFLPISIEEPNKVPF